jgi:hypothetical protein
MLRTTPQRGVAIPLAAPPASAAPRCRKRARRAYVREREPLRLSVRVLSVVIARLTYVERQCVPLLTAGHGESV